MQYDENRSEYVLSTGKRFYSNGPMLGLNADLTEITEGYDGQVWADGDTWFTPAELCEIADHEIERWQRFKEKHTCSDASESRS